MEYRSEQIPEDTNEVEQITIEHAMHLINKWIESKSIEGINTHAEIIMKDDFTDADSWVHPIKIV